MIFDFDDHHPGNNAMPWLRRLKEIRADFKVTLFAVPGLGDDAFWDAHPEWVELAVHGYMHGGPACQDAHECADWSFHRMITAIQTRPHRFERGFKAPGWQISDGSYPALKQLGWWVADQPYNDDRRPHGLRVHRLSPTASSGEDPHHWHGHVQNVCGNGLEETFPQLLDRVRAAESFEFMSEAVTPWTG